jgi:hypothetical protein
MMMTVAKEMNNGVALLLERMKTHPDEFIGVKSKWGQIIRLYEDHLELEDYEALKAGTNKIMQQAFTEKVLEELVDPKKLELEDVIKQYRATGISSVGQTLVPSLTAHKAMAMGATLSVATNPNSITLGSTTINESHLEHLRAHVDAMKREVDNQELKKPKTIFGRLFNYQ